MINNEYKAPKENTKDTYDKLFGGGANNIFSENGFDEMQKTRNYEIEFRVFRIFFWIAYIMAAAVICTGMAVESVLVTAVGLVFLGVCNVFYLWYAAKVSAMGVMNIDFAKRMSQRSVLIVYLFVAVIWIICSLSANSIFWGTALMMIMLSVLYIGLHICAKRNMKVLEKMLKENEEEQL